MMIQSVSYNQSDDTLKRDIATLFHFVWPELAEMPITSIPEAHEEELHAQSFYIYVNQKLVSYAGVVQKEVEIEGETYIIAGLSCVGTHPDYRKQQYGRRIVYEATKWIQQQGTFDFGVFTCHPTLAEFYEKAGNWQVEPNVILLGSANENALSSEELDVVVLMQLLSEKAYANEEEIRNATIYLNFPEGYFL